MTKINSPNQRLSWTGAHVTFFGHLSIRSLRFKKRRVLISIFRAYDHQLDTHGSVEECLSSQHDSHHQYGAVSPRSTDIKRFCHIRKQNPSATDSGKRLFTTPKGKGSV
uniref:Uncharacterized protein n=1 Tax=Caenorhabditis japonica TaxID=281687 RepID=A0A8R1E9L6_CAEJA